MADKKISELPKINAISGSTVILPIVHDGTTQRMDVSAFSVYTSRESAKTGSANTFTGNQTINGNLTLSGNSVIGGNVEVGGMITAQQYNVTYVSSSVQFKSGSTEFGDSIDDTHTITGTLILNGLAIGTAQLMAQTASQNAINNGVSAVTGAFAVEFDSIDAHILKQAIQTGSQDLVNLGISTYTGSQNVINTSVDSHILKQAIQTGSQDLVNLGISTFTGSQNVINSSVDAHILGISTYTSSIGVINTSIDAHILKQATQTGSQDLVNLGISSVTGSLIGITNTLMAFTAALDNTYATDAQLYQLYQATSSIQFTTRSLNTQTGSQDLVNLAISTYTGSQNVINSSVDSHILKQATQTGSQDLVNLGISSVTGSLIGITNGLMAFTAALDNTYATDAQLYQLYHATASLNTQTGSQDLVNLSISTYTGSQNVINSSVDVHILKQATQTGSQDLVNLGISSVTGSLIGITNGLMAFTAALDSTYATDAQLYQLYQATASIQFATASLNTQTGSQNTINFNISVVTSSIDSHILKQATQTGSQDLVNLGISTFTGSLRSEVNGIEAYTASLKGAIEVSGQNVNVLGMITAQQFNVTYVSSSVMYQSGSNKFGDSSDDKHEFTGSVNINGNFVHNATTASFAGLVGIRRTTPEFTLDVDGDIALNRFNKLQFTGGTVGDRARSYLAGNGNNDILVYGPSNNLIATFAHYTNLGIRTLAPDTTLHISGSDGIKIQAGGNGDTPGLSIINYTNQFVWAKFGAGLQGNGKGFATISNWDGSGLNEKVRVSGDGDLTITDGNLVVANGKGIDFSATSNSSGTTTSELLNDYEEGTWTPVLADDPLAGNLATGTFAGHYTKVGRLVTLQASLNSITTSGMTAGNILYIRGLPFAIGGSTQISAGAANFFNITFGDCAVVWVNAAAGTGYMRILKQTSGSVNAALIVSNVTSTTGEISFTIQYHV
jgi:NDP-sugar pyrophosphorylase family protein